MEKKMLVILGQTSTGKTDLALKLAKKLNGEIISADSRQIYKKLDIGTGKEPTNGSEIRKENGYWEVNGVKIWLYDVVEPGERYNLYQFVTRAEKTVYQISERGKLPILAGGTGLYIRSLIEGISDFGIEENNKLRKNIENLETGEIRKRINEQDSEILKDLNNSDINNKRRLIRILEKLSSKKPEKSFHGLGEKFDILKIGLQADRKILAKRIKERVIKRIDAGMIEESERLLEKKILTLERMEELGLEYRYIAKFITGEIKSKEELIEILSLKVKQFAKRQETWFKKDTEIFWLDISDDLYIRKVEDKVLNWYNTVNE